MSAKVHLLIAGDLHLGRRSARLPPELAADRRFSAAAAWLRLVELARAERVDAVVLTGDVIDRENRYYEAVGPLEKGIAELAAAGIPVFAVAGNHDWNVLPRLAAAHPTFHLLGAGGRWERRGLEREGKVLLHFDGWSFPRDRFTNDPLDGYDLPPSSELPALGLLHCDLAGNPGSPYAPTSLARLRRVPVGAWLLGHLHAPWAAPDPGAPVVYPGSLQALDPGELGSHGAVRLELEGRRILRLEHLPLSAVRYESAALELGEAGDLDDFDRRLTELLRSVFARSAAEGGGALACLVLRLAARGATTLHGRLAAPLAQLTGEPRYSGALIAVFDAAVDETRPALDLEALAAAEDPAGALARLLVRFEQGAEHGAVLSEALDRLEAVSAASAYAHLTQVDDKPSPATALRALKAAGYRLLAELLAQKSGLGSAP